MSISPERKFWCAVIGKQVSDAQAGHTAAQRWFHSYMWERVSGSLFTADLSQAIEDKVLTSAVKRSFTLKQLEARRKFYKARYSRLKAERNKKAK